MKPLILAALCGVAVLTAGPARAEEDDAARAARWKDVQQAVFGNRPVLDGHAMLTLKAPPRALDAALVPMAMEVADGTPVKGLYLIIDDNPSPLAAHFSFGPAADPHEIRVRVRVDQYTEVHAVVETPDGKLYGVEDFVKAAGGCSAPAGASEAEALKGLGEMKLRTLGTYAPGKPLQVQLLIRHPNFNGMQMDQLSRMYTPARFIDATDVSYEGAQVFHLDSDISLSSDPAITFSFMPKSKGTLTVVAKDSKETTFRHSFDIPPEGS